jgi:DNA-binding NarL/FixJ family response regulator
MDLELLDALIIDPDPASRMRLKQATSTLNEFRNVRLATSLQRALDDMNDTLECNIVFISQTFEPEKSAAFVKAAKETKNGQYSAYVLVVDGKRQKRTAVANDVSNGMDGILFQPFSVDGLRQATELAYKVRGKNKTERLSASKHLLGDAITPSIDKITDLFLEGKKSDLLRADLKMIMKALMASCDGKQDEFFDHLVNLFDKAPVPAPPKDSDWSLAAQKKRRKLEQEIVERIAAEEAAAAAAAQEEAQKQKSGGGYFTPKIRRK